MARRDAFSGYHPAVNAAYFACVITLTMLLRHPACTALSLAGAAVYSACLSGRRAWRFALRFVLPLALFSAVLNPLFTHEGATILAYLPGGNPLTAESIWYGAFTGALLAAALLWFSCVSAVLTDDKLVFLFGRAAPALGLLLSMALRFVPRLALQAKRIWQAQRSLSGRPEGLRARWRLALTEFSALLTWALESGVETAASMRCRGYGLPGRTAFSIYRFDRRDGAGLALALACTGLTALGAGLGALDFRFYPTVRAAAPGLPGAAALLVFGALCFWPAYLSGKEARQWKRLQSAI